MTTVSQCTCAACQLPPSTKGYAPPPPDEASLRLAEACRLALGLAVLGTDGAVIASQLDACGFANEAVEATTWAWRVFSDAAPRHVDPPSERHRVELALAAMDAGDWLHAAQLLHRVPERLARWALSHKEAP